MCISYSGMVLLSWGTMSLCKNRPNTYFTIQDVQSTYSLCKNRPNTYFTMQDVHSTYSLCKNRPNTYFTMQDVHSTYSLCKNRPNTYFTIQYVHSTYSLRFITSAQSRFVDQQRQFLFWRIAVCVTHIGNCIICLANDALPTTWAPIVLITLKQSNNICVLSVIHAECATLTSISNHYLNIW